MIRTQESATAQKFVQQSMLHASFQVAIAATENRLGKRLPAMIGSAFINLASITLFKSHGWCGGAGFNVISRLSSESTDYRNRPEPNNIIRSGECRHLTAIPT